MLVTKIREYPWKYPDVKRDYNVNYRNLVVDGGADAKEFWKLYPKAVLTADFKTLIQSMLAFDITVRPTIGDVIASNYMTGAVLNKEEFNKQCEPMMKRAADSVEKENAALGSDFEVQLRRSLDDDETLDQLKAYLGFKFRTFEQFIIGSQSKQFTIKGKPLDIMKLLYQEASKINDEIRISKTNWKFSFNCEIERDQELE